MNVYVDLDNRSGFQEVCKALEFRLKWQPPTHLFVKKGSFLTDLEFEFDIGQSTNTIYRSSHPFGYNRYAKWPVKDVYEKLKALQNNKLPQSEILWCQVLFLEKPFVNFGKMMDRKEWLSESWSPALREDMVEDLREDLQFIGYNKDIQPWLHQQIEQRAVSFSHQDTIVFDGRDKMACNFCFVLDQNGGGYAMPEYDLKLLVKTDIEHGMINGIDTRQLDESMQKINWHYQFIDTPSEVMKEYNKAVDIKAELSQLCKSETGARIAMQLWNNYIPTVINSKPDAIKKAEEQTDLYPQATFTWDTPIKRAVAYLKETFPEKLSLEAGAKPGAGLTSKGDDQNNPVQIARLELRMKNTDWHFCHSDDFEVWRDGYVEIGKIKAELEKLSAEPGGKAIARELWDKYVPNNTVAKPECLEKAKIVTTASKPSSFTILPGVAENSVSVIQHRMGTKKQTANTENTAKTIWKRLRNKLK